MGAELWHHAAPWRPDPDAALFDLQVAYLDDLYDLPDFVAGHLGWIPELRGMLQAIAAAGDEDGLLDYYRGELVLREEIAGRPIPTDPGERIELVRRLSAGSGEGTRSILDIRRVSTRRDYEVAERLDDAELIRLVGTNRPTLTQTRRAVDVIDNGNLGRGECVCFPFYDDHNPGQPAGWYFVGNTSD